MQYIGYRRFLVGCIYTTNLILKVENGIRKSLDYLILIAFCRAGRRGRTAPLLAQQKDFLNITSRIDDILKSYERLLGLGERTESTAQDVSKCEARDGSDRCESSPHANFLSTTPQPCFIHCARQVTMQRLFSVPSLFITVMLHLDFDCAHKFAHVP
jgi:hypothetical protein